MQAGILVGCALMLSRLLHLFEYAARGLHIACQLLRTSQEEIERHEESAKEAAESLAALQTQKARDERQLMLAVAAKDEHIMRLEEEGGRCCCCCCRRAELRITQVGAGRGHTARGARVGNSPTQARSVSPEDTTHDTPL